MYQKCPICNGLGTTFDHNSINTSAVCPTCKGARIINEITGLPPNYTTTQTPINLTTIIDNPELLTKENNMKDQEIREDAMSWFFGLTEIEKFDLKEKYFPNEFIPHDEKWGYHFTVSQITEMYNQLNQKGE